MEERDTRSVAPEVTYVERKERAPRNYLVFVSSIILAIAAFIGFIAVVLGTIAMVSPSVEIPREIRVEPVFLIISAILILSQLIFAIIGLASSRLPRRGKLLMVFGLIMVLGQVADTIIMVITGTFSSGFVFGILLKILYTVGGYQLYQRHRKSYETVHDYEEI